MENRCEGLCARVNVREGLFTCVRLRGAHSLVRGKGCDRFRVSKRAVGCSHHYVDEQAAYGVPVPVMLGANAFPTNRPSLHERKALVSCKGFEVLSLLLF